MDALLEAGATEVIIKDAHGTGSTSSPSCLVRAELNGRQVGEISLDGQSALYRDDDFVRMPSRAL